MASSQRHRKMSHALQNDLETSASTSKVVGVLTIEDIIEELLQTEVVQIWRVSPAELSILHIVIPSNLPTFFSCLLQIIDETDRFVVSCNSLQRVPIYIV